MQTTANYGLKKPDGTDVVNIQDLNDNADAIDTALAGKVDKVTGKQLSTEDYTTTEKSKLAGVAAGANNYVHPSTHPPAIITQDSSNRFVTDSEKSTWNSKAGTAVATTSANGLMSSTDKSKLDGIAAGANAYVHPSGDGNQHVPATGTTHNGQVLKAGATAGSAAWGTLAKGDVGLSNVDNTADSAKNVASAAKFTTARTISLNGDASGSASFDGSANVAITVTVADDSHNHIITNVDGLQDALNGAIPTSQKGVANGVATLDSDGKVPTSQLPVTPMSYGYTSFSADFPAVVNDFICTIATKSIPIGNDAKEVEIVFPNLSSMKVYRDFNYVIGFNSGNSILQYPTVSKANLNYGSTVDMSVHSNLLYINGLFGMTSVNHDICIFDAYISGANLYLKFANTSSTSYTSKSQSFYYITKG